MGSEMCIRDKLLTGHHKNIAEWRLEKSLELTREIRPDMYEKYINDCKNK